MYSCFLDASKAFDKVHYGKLFNLMLKRGVPSVIVIGVRANINLGGQTEFCPNGEHNLFVMRPRQGEKIIMN